MESSKAMFRSQSCIQASPVVVALSVSVLPLSFAPLPPGIRVHFDQQQGQTVITARGESAQGKPILFVLDQFYGTKPSAANIASVGFLVAQGCARPKFFVNNQVVVSSPLAEFVSGKNLERSQTSQGVKSYNYVYNFYGPTQIQQIASATSVQYEICSERYTLSAKDQATLRQFLSEIAVW